MGYALREWSCFLFIHFSWVSVLLVFFSVFFLDGEGDGGVRQFFSFWLILPLQLFPCPWLFFYTWAALCFSLYSRRKSCAVRKSTFLEKKQTFSDTILWPSDHVSSWRFINLVHFLTSPFVRETRQINKQIGAKMWEQEAVTEWSESKRNKERLRGWKTVESKQGNGRWKAWRCWGIFWKWLAVFVVSGFYNPVLWCSNLPFLLCRVNTLITWGKADDLL